MSPESVLLVVSGVVAVVCAVLALIEQSEPERGRRRLLSPEELERREIEAGLIPGFEGAVAMAFKDGSVRYRLPDGTFKETPLQEKRRLEEYERSMQRKWGDTPTA